MSRTRGGVVWGRSGGSAASTFAAWDFYTDDDRLLTFLHWSASADRLLEEGRVRAVVRLREKGVSWAEIGRWLGITKQAAQQRFGGVTRPVASADESTLHAALGTERA